MNNLLFSLQIMAPILMLLLIGFLIRLSKIMTDDTVKRVNKMIFWIFTPMLVFDSIYNNDTAIDIQSNFVIFCVLGILVQFFIALAVVLLGESENSKRGSMLQGMFRSNFVIYGIPIATAIAGAAAGGYASLLIAIVIPLYNVLSVIALEMFNGKSPSFFKTLLGIIKNPLILSSVLAILLRTFQVQVPSLINNTIQDVASITSTLAFIMLGAYFSFSDVGKHVKPLTLTVLFKLVIFPAIFIGAAVLLGFRGGELAVILGIFSAPVAISSFTMAQEMGGDATLSAQIIVFTSLLSILTIFLLIFLLRQFSLF